MRPGCTTLATATGAISPIARLPSAATRCGACRSRPSIFSAPSAMPKSTRPRNISSACTWTRSRSVGRPMRGGGWLRICWIAAARRCRNTISVRPATSCANRCGDGSIRTGRETGRPGSTNSHLKSVSSTPTSRAISARPDGSASDGQRNSAGRRVLRWSRSHSWRRWSRARHRGSARRSRPTP